MFDEFIESQTNPNNKFWWQYLGLVSIMLLFTRSLRQGLWDLYVYSFRCMLPFFMRYDHTNYTRWGSVYLAETQQLPAEILNEFKNGNFVVKRTKSKFNQVDPDQGQEWLNSTGKSGGGIVGITKTSSALARWALSYNLRSDIASRTYEIFHASSDGMLSHKECSKGRKDTDANAEKTVREEIVRLNIFSVGTEVNEVLQNAATKDQATQKVSDSLLNARNLGQKQLESFVSERLIEKTVSLRATLSKNKAPTFASLYNVTQKSRDSEKSSIVKVDRNVMKRLITAYEAGRDVNLAEVLQHELMPVPVSIAELNGNLKSGTKANLGDVLLKGIECPESVTLCSPSSIIFDGQALVQSLGKPNDARTFGDYADFLCVLCYIEEGTAHVLMMFLKGI